MTWGAAMLALFVLYVSAKGELPTYLGFLVPQGSATAPPAQTVLGTAASETVPFMSGQPAASTPGSQEMIPWTTVPGALIGG